MSVKVMTRVWEQSPHKGSPLLCHLSLADNADDDGVCWPGKVYVQKKIRMSARQTIRLIEELEDSGELFRRTGVGRGNKTLYFVTTGLAEDQIADVLMRRFGLRKKDAILATLQIMEKRCHFVALKGDKLSIKGDISDNKKSASKPRGKKANGTKRKKTTVNKNRNTEPSESSADADPKPIPPHVQIIEAYHAALPDDVRPPGKANISRNSVAACALRDDGITPVRVADFVAKTYPSYRKWAERNSAPALMTLEHVKQYIRAWEAKQAKKVGSQNANSQQSAEDVAKRQRETAERFGLTA